MSVGSLPSLGMEQTWTFDRLAVTLSRTDFLDPDVHADAEESDDVRERGVRLGIRPVETAYTGSVYSSPSVRLLPAVCRIDLLESAPHAADRMHWHPAMTHGEPGQRTFDVGMVDDPLGWLADHLHHLNDVVNLAPIEADIEAIRSAVPDIVEATRRGLAWARTNPWPEVEHDHRGLATCPQITRS